MTSSIAPGVDLRGNLAKYAVLLGDTSGNMPTSIDDRVPYKLLAIHRPANGRQVNRIEVEVPLERVELRYEDTTVPVEHNRLLEVRLIEAGGTVGPCLCWGRIAAQGATLDDKREQLTMSARITGNLVGGVLEEYFVWDETVPAAVDVNGDIVFNPTVDNGVGGRKQETGNRSTKTQADDGWYYFAEPGSFKSSGARAGHSPEAVESWLLSQAIETLCWILNPDETFLTNPEAADLTALDTDETLLVNARIKQGANLFEALDALLLPLSIGWHLMFEGDIGSVVTKLSFFRYGEGPAKDIPAGRIGEPRTLSGSLINNVKSEYDIDSVRNVLIGHSALKRREVTVPLYGGWSSTHDTIDWEDFDNEDDHKPDGKLRDVGRLWLMGEDGGLTDVRSGAPANVVPTWEDITPAPLVKRRTMQKCLTLDTNGEPIGHDGFYLTWEDREGNERKFEWSFRVLKDRIGIYFDGQIPREIWDAFKAAPNSFALKLTGSVELDETQRYIAVRRPESPSGVDSPQLLKLGGKFSSDLLQDSGALASRFYATRAVAMNSLVATDPGTIDVTGDVTDRIKPGQRLAIVSSDDHEGVYTATDVTFAGGVTTIQVQGKIPDGDGTGTVILNALAEDCIQRLEAYVTKLHERQDHAVAPISVTLDGIEHGWLEQGDLITGLSGRNITFNTATTTPRYPQLVGVGMKFEPKQKLVLELEEPADE